MNDWFYALDGKQNGPVPLQQLMQLREQGLLHAGSLVWSEGLPQWTPYEQAMLSASQAAPAHSREIASVEENLHVADAAPEKLEFKFTGRAGEFFRIWIVNVALTVLTLGIYAAWAKVRTRRYFHGNLLLDGKPFDFTGNPVAILKGNLVFGALFLVYAVAGSVFPPLALAVMLVILVLAPWMVQKALRFRARNTVYRNVRFRFQGSLGESYAVFLGLAFLIPLTLGLIIPYLQFRQRNYYLGNLAWGGCEARMDGTAGFFYKTFLKCFGFFLLIIAVVSLAVGALTVVATKAAGDGTRGAATAAQSEMQAEIDKAVEQSLRGRTDLSDEEKESARKAARQVGENMQQMVLLAVIPAYLGMFLIMIFYQVRTTNYCINSTQWGQLGRLESSVRIRDLLWLYLTNGLAVLLSLGLLIPWAMVRMARYRAERTVLIASRSGMDGVSQSAAGNESALGDAGADIFDFEIGF